jgi:hypothetical protein
MCEAFRRLRARGAERALVETNDDRGPALAAYHAVGFRSQHVALRKGRWIIHPGAPADG